MQLIVRLQMLNLEDGRTHNLASLGLALLMYSAEQFLFRASLQCSYYDNGNLCTRVFVITSQSSLGKKYGGGEISIDKIGKKVLKILLNSQSITHSFSTHRNIHSCTVNCLFWAKRFFISQETHLWVKSSIMQRELACMDVWMRRSLPLRLESTAKSSLVMFT